MGDITNNHTGDAHEWFVAADADPDGQHAGWYVRATRPDGSPGDWVTWMGVPSGCTRA